MFAVTEDADELELETQLLDVAVEVVGPVHDGRC